MRANHFYGLFEKQFGDLPIGGFINPEIIKENNEDLIFRCHYDDFEGEEDVWHYGFDLTNRQFYSY